jgi:membrane-associated phospholipid phosphatase
VGLRKHEKIIIVSLTIILISFFTFYDLQFSKLVVNETSTFGKFFYMFGELPGTFGGLVSFAILTTSYTKDNQKARDTNIIFYGSITLLLGFILSFQVIRYLKLELFPYLFIGLFVSMALLYWSNQLSDEKKNHIRSYAYIGALTLVLGIIIPQLLKIIWARPRYRILYGDDTLYQAWFIISGLSFDNNWKSFPSGHSATASISLVYLYLPQLFDKFKGKERTILKIVGTWIILVMISRVVIGDHFMTDTLFGSGLTIIIFIVLNKLFNPNKKGII